MPFFREEEKHIRLKICTKSVSL